MGRKVVIPSSLRRKIGQAMDDYSMLSDGDRVLVAVSGGIDSLSLLCLLHLWREKAPIDFFLHAIHIDHGFWKKTAKPIPPEITIGDQITKKGIQLEIEQEYHIVEEQRSCFLCARNRRNQLFELARKRNFNKVCFGHHKDDLLETFMINIMFSGNISTMVPRQDIFNGNLSIIRPFAYLEKSDVRSLGALFGLTPVKNYCPLASNAKRERVRFFLTQLFEEEPGIRDSMFAALSNVRNNYLLSK